jgi:hypothetical protein
MAENSEAFNIHQLFVYLTLYEYIEENANLFFLATTYISYSLTVLDTHHTA